MMQYDPNMKPALVDETLSWFDGSALCIGGKGWVDTNKIYTRLPKKAEGVVRSDVWSLSQSSAGVRIHFRSNSPTLAVRWDGQSAMAHMPATGVSGVDLYVFHESQWKWLAVGQPLKEENEALLVSNLGVMKRDYILYLPLYNKVEKVLIGITHDSKISASEDFHQQKPIVFYGTSITQGGCASRPGMAYPAILGRALKWPTINLGFSGNGKVEPEMIDLLSELDAKVFVLDNLPNLEEPLITERLPYAIEKLRKMHANTPIVMIENIRYCGSYLKSDRKDRYNKSNQAYKNIFLKYSKAGDKNLVSSN